MGILKLSYLNGLIVAITIGALFALYLTNQSAKELERQVIEINKQINKERNNIAMLEKEWQYLTTPDRIDSKSAQLLPYLKRPDPSQIVTLQRLKQALYYLSTDKTAVSMTSSKPESKPEVAIKSQ